MAIRVDIKGLDDSLKKLKDLPRVFDEELSKAMNDEGLDWRDDVRANTPVDSGDLRRSWIFAGVEKSGFIFEMDLSNNMEYADYVEYGHRQEPGRFVPAIGKRLKANYVSGYYMLRDGTNRLEESLPKSLEEAIAIARSRLNG